MSPLWLVLSLLPILGGAERFNCKTRILGAYYADAKSGCKAFHVCVRVAGGGVRDFRFFCPPGTLFHQEAQTCTDWGDDDPLACPADIYDGQFDLYKIGSGYDTKKVSSAGNREEEDFGLQRAETGDRRLHQNNINSNAGASDLRTAHSSDFFSGQRERGRDEVSVPAASQPTSPPSAPPRQSFRRASTTRQPPTQYTPTIPTTQPPKLPQYEVTSKRKLVRKRPVYVSTPAPTTYLQEVASKKSTSSLPQQYFNRRTTLQNKASLAPVSIPTHFQKFKDEYVEVSRVTPKPSKSFSSKANSASFTQTASSPYFKKKENLVELYNYETQTTPEQNGRNDNQQSFNLRNNINVFPDVPKISNFVGEKLDTNFNVGRDATTAAEYNTIPSRGFSSSTPVSRNYNSVSYEPEKNRANSFSSNKQNFYNSYSSTPITTTIYTTSRPEQPLNLNTVAYNTNIGINAQVNNYAESEEDDGQYRLPPNEDDGQYRPELYERELLAGAHSLNIAASGNRLPEDQKPRKQQPQKLIPETAPPRPFRPSPTTTVKQTYPTTVPPQTIEPRTFDYFQTYTTTSRPSEVPPVYLTNVDDSRVKVITTPASRTPFNKKSEAFTDSPKTTAFLPRQSTPAKKPHFAKPANNKEDTSYDYAYYDTDPGFTEYDHIEEFGKTKTKKA